MKKAILIGFLMVLMAAPGVMALQIQIGYLGSSYGPYQTGSGGEFTVRPFDGLEWVLNLYDSSAKNIGVTGTFQTFCIEVGEYIDGYAATYNVVLNNNAMFGGNAPAGDPISKGTAWLYHEFQLGRLVGKTSAGADYYYDYDNNDHGRNTDADFLQRTIWWLEGEAGQPTIANPFYNAVILLPNYTADNLGYYPVMAMNLYDANKGQHQDLLVCVPEPASFLLLGLGLLGVGVFARRRFKK